jgi:hypothetical protein
MGGISAIDSYLTFSSAQYFELSSSRSLDLASRGGFAVLMHFERANAENDQVLLAMEGTGSCSITVIMVRVGELSLLRIALTSSNGFPYTHDFALELRNAIAEVVLLSFSTDFSHLNLYHYKNFESSGASNIDDNSGDSSAVLAQVCRGLAPAWSILMFPAFISSSSAGSQFLSSTADGE